MTRAERVEALVEYPSFLVGVALLMPLLLLCALPSEWRVWRTGSRYTAAERDYIERWSS